MTNRPIRRFSELLGLLESGKFEQACDEALTEALSSLEQMPKDEGKDAQRTARSSIPSAVPVQRTLLPIGSAVMRS